MHCNALREADQEIRRSGAEVSKTPSSTALGWRDWLKKNARAEEGLRYPMAQALQ